jgi:hypothetical protein
MHQVSNGTSSTATLHHRGIQCREIAQCTERRWNRAREQVLVEVQHLKIDQASHRCWKCACKLVVVKEPAPTNQPTSPNHHLNHHLMILHTYSSTSCVRLDSESGTVPVNWLPKKFNSLKRVRLPTTDGMLPCRWLLFIELKPCHARSV